MRIYLTEREIKEIIINDFRSRGEYADYVKFENPHVTHGCYVDILPNPMCTHEYNNDSTLREVNGKVTCSICGAEFNKIE